MLIYGHKPCNLQTFRQDCFGAHKHQINTKSMKQKPYFFKPKIWGILRVVASTRGRFADSTLLDRPH